MSNRVFMFVFRNSFLVYKGVIDIFSEGCLILAIAKYRLKARFLPPREQNFDNKRCRAGRPVFHQIVAASCGKGHEWYHLCYRVILCALSQHSDPLAARVQSRCH